MAEQIKIDGIDFWGYYQLNDQMNKVGGVYVIFDGNGKFIDVGQSDNFNIRPKNHDRLPCWQKNCTDGIYFAAKVIDNKDQRTVVEQSIRNMHPEMPCGER